MKSLPLDVLVVGAGFAGLFELYRLRALGYTVKIFEEGSEVGGVWYCNCYPGARVDSVVPVYAFSDENLWKDWSWTERYPGWKELRRYFQYVDEKLDLRKNIVFNRRVVSARWNEDIDRWLVTSQDGSVISPRFLVLCVGNTTKIHIPNIAGMNKFRGECHHTGRWPQEDIDLEGKRVAVIGVGPSGVQVVQDVGPRVSQLTVYQRTPHIAFPMHQKSIDAETSKRTKQKMYSMVYGRRRQTGGGHYYDSYPKRWVDATVEERFLFFEGLWNTVGGLQILASNYQDIQSNREANDDLYAFWRMKVSERLHNNRVRDILSPSVPPHPVGAKRTGLEISYYEVFNLQHVDLVDLTQNPIVEFTANGIITADGHEREFDVIVLATGFDATTGPIIDIDIEGTDEISIGDKWAKGVRTYLGMMTANFPNMFFLYGPHGPLSNGPTSIEIQGEWVNDCIKYMMENNLTRIEPLREAEEEWRQAVFESMSTGLYEAPTSVLLGRNIPGKISEPLVYFGGVPKYSQICRDKKEKGYEGCYQSSKYSTHVDNGGSIIGIHRSV